MSRLNPVSNSDDVIDSRDVIAAVESLESQIEDCDFEIEAKQDAIADCDSSTEEGRESIADLNLDLDDLRNQKAGLEDELRPLKLFADDAENCSSDWKYGATLIRDSYFEDFARQEVEDVGDLPKDLPWYIESNINWEGVAEDLQQDYSSVEFDGVTYWVR